MDALLTTKQLQDLLKVDRTTIYRMLKSGRLTGVKVGNQWRFPRQAVLEQLAAEPVEDVVDVEPEVDPPVPSSSPADVIPLPCVQAIQDVFAEIADVGSVATDPDGNLLTKISNCRPFCRLIQSSETGYEGCMASWRKLADVASTKPEFFKCHAGLQYACARIEVRGNLTAMLIAGQFYATPPVPAAEQRRVTQLAEDHSLDADKLAEAVKQVPVLTERAQARIGEWLEKVATTFAQVGTERAAYIDRLRQIAEMSTVDPSHT
jgi:excisionase family DNA binding protein